MRKLIQKDKEHNLGSAAIEALFALGLLSIVAAGSHKLFASQISHLRLAETNIIEKNAFAAKAIEDSLEKFQQDILP
ncbi:MAG: hypothetical protein PHC51_02095 [bacterium]|nr:hypothetical protein [bacterium]